MLIIDIMVYGIIKVLVDIFQPASRSKKINYHSDQNWIYHDFYRDEENKDSDDPLINGDYDDGPDW